MIQIYYVRRQMVDLGWIKVPRISSTLQPVYEQCHRHEAEGVVLVRNSYALHDGLLTEEKAFELYKNEECVRTEVLITN